MNKIAPLFYRWSPILYVLRISLFVLCLGLIGRSGFHLIEKATDLNHHFLASLLAQADIYRSLFWAVVLPFAAFLFLPAGKEPVRKRYLLPISIAMGFITYLLISKAPMWMRPNVESRADAYVTAFYVGLNLALFTWFHFGNRWTGKSRKIFVGVIGLSDLLFPPLTWSAHRKERRFVLILARPVPMFLVCFAPLLPWVISPLKYNVTGEYGPPVKVIEQRTYYQVIADQSTGSLVIVDDISHAIKRFHPDHPMSFDEAPLISEMTQVLGFDGAARKLVYVAPEKGETRIHDFDTLELNRVISWKAPIPEMSAWMTFWNRKNQVLGSLSAGGIMHLCPDGMNFKASYYIGQTVGVAYDEMRNEIHCTNWSDHLITLNADTLKPIRSLIIPKTAERLAIDSECSRLFVACPVAGKVLVVDLDSYKIIDVIKTMPGVRIVTLDEGNNQMLLSGFSPFIEIRSLDVYSLVNRLHCPHWTRWAEIHPTKNMAYITSRNIFWSLDLEAAGTPSLKSTLNRLDPYFYFYQIANELAQSFMFQSGSETPDVLPDFPHNQSSEPCSADVWLDEAEEKSINNQ